MVLAVVLVVRHARHRSEFVSQRSPFCCAKPLGRLHKVLVVPAVGALSSGFVEWNKDPSCLLFWSL